MKKFLILTLLLFISLSSAQAEEGIILRPAFFPQISENNFTNFYPIPTLKTPEILTETNKHQEQATPSCIQNPKIEFFMYHYIRHTLPGESADLKKLSVSPEIFREHMATISLLAKNHKITLMNGSNLVKAMKNNCFPSHNVWIFTADDGWEDNYYQLATIAKEYEIPFIFGIISGKINAKNFVTESQLKEIAENPLFTIASHTITHPKLNYGSLQKAKSEICDSKKQLEKIINKPVEIIIYPYGIMGNNTTRFTKECNYELGFSTHYGRNFSWKEKNFYNINRINITENISPEFFENHAK